MGAVSWFPAGKIVLSCCSLCCEVSVIIERVISFCIEKSVTDSEADFLAGERSKAGDVVEDFVEAVLVTRFIYQGCKGVAAVEKHEYN